MEALYLFGGFGIFLLMRVPIAVAAGLSATLYILLTGMFPLSLASLAAFQGLDSFTLLAVPFFVLAGQIMAHGGIAKYLLKLADAMLGSMPGGYAMTTVLASTFFADLSGSSPATVAAIGSIMVPAMEKHNYKKDFAAAVCACAGCLSVIIPPSNPMVVYGVATDTSIGRLFLAGIVPGIMVALSLAIPAYFISKKNGWKGNTNATDREPLGVAFRKSVWALLVPVIIMGGIYGGIFTPTESAAVACLYAIIVGLFLYKEFGFKDIPRLLRAGAVTIVPLMLIVGMAAVFSQVISLLGVPTKMARALQSVTDNPLLLLLIINLFLLFIGMVMETVAAIVLLAPILMPLVVELGIDPVHFGIIMIINLAVGFITPPLGVNLFVANSISKVPSEKVFVAALPFVFSMFICLALIIVFPSTCLFLPELFYGK